MKTLLSSVVSESSDLDGKAPGKAKNWANLRLSFWVQQAVDNDLDRNLTGLPGNEVDIGGLDKLSTHPWVTGSPCKCSREIEKVPEF